MRRVEAGVAERRSKRSATSPTTGCGDVPSPIAVAVARILDDVASRGGRRRPGHCRVESSLGTGLGLCSNWRVVARRVFTLLRPNPGIDCWTRPMFWPRSFGVVDEVAIVGAPRVIWCTGPRCAVPARSYRESATDMSRDELTPVATQTRGGCDQGVRRGSVANGTGDKSQTHAVFHDHFLLYSALKSGLRCCLGMARSRSGWSEPRVADRVVSGP